MINKLRKVFKTLHLYKEGTSQLDLEYKWFTTPEHEIIGIHKEELTTKDLALLTAFLSPYNIQFPVLTGVEKKWKALIYPTEFTENPTIEIDHAYRFVYFTIQKNQSNPVSFNDAIYEMFGMKIPILWMSGHEGIIIEEQMQEEDRISYEQIIDVLMSDLYVKINFFVGPFKNDLEAVDEYYQMIIEAAKIAIRYSNEAVMTYIEAIPYLFINHTEENLRSEIGKTVLQEYIDDEETLKMIETFVQCNLNISETSKELHMHRNSLQYRLDRFYEKTGIDVRQFSQAMTVYLVLLARK